MNNRKTRWNLGPIEGSSFHTNFRNLLSRRLKELGLHDTTLADRMNTNDSSIYLALRKVGNPVFSELGFLLNLCTALDVTVDIKLGIENSGTEEHLIVRGDDLPSYKDNLGRLVQLRRKAKDLSLPKFAKLVDRNFKWIEQLERASQKDTPMPKTLDQLFKSMGIAVILTVN